MDPGAATELEISDGRIAFDDAANPKKITFFATISNRSKHGWESPVVAVEFLDPAGERVDFLREMLYSVSLAPGEAKAFRIQQAPAESASRYASHAARIEGARRSR